MNEKTIGYARTASGEQDIAPQIERLKAAGCSLVYTDRAASGSGLDRAGLKEARANLQAGDTLKVVSIDRLARSASALDTLVTNFSRNHINFEAVNEPDAAMALRIRTALNYGPVITSETPWWRALAYRAGSFLIRISGRGAVPPI